MGTLWRSCVKVREAIELPFGMVSGVGPAIGVLDAVNIFKGKGRFGGFPDRWGFLVHWFQWRF